MPPRCMMRAISVKPGVADSAVLGSWPEPEPTASVLVQTLAVGVCGTDIEILRGEYGSAPEGAERLILGHEALVQVVEATADSGYVSGDLAVPMVRWPDPVPCSNCAVGEWDMCRNGLFAEHGIKGRHGFAVERFYIEPKRLVGVPSDLGQLGVLIEPASILAKAWEHIERIGRRTLWTPARDRVPGAGPIGLLAALMAGQRGFATDVLDLVTEGPKPQLVRDLGADYHSEGLDSIRTHHDVVLECTGVAPLVFDVMRHSAPGGVVCVTGGCSGCVF